jgi:tetratricopeptide (TPR) repeat protein
LGRVQHAQGDYEGAEKSFQRALEIRRKTFDLGHPHLAASGIDLARLDLEFGRCRQAEGRLQTSLATFLATKEIGAWELAEVQSLLGAALVCLGELEQGETLLRSGLERLEETRGERSIYTLQARQRLKEAMETLGIELVENTG